MASKCTLVTVLLAVLLSVAVHYIFQFLVTAGVFSSLHHSHYPGHCKKIEGIQPGSEGMHMLSNGLTFITSGVRVQDVSRPGFEDFYRSNNIKGRVYIFDLKKSDAGVRELQIASTKQFDVNNFHPHGISVWEDKQSGHHLVFIVNHAMGEPVADRVEKFLYNSEKQELVHQASYSDKSFKILNDVQAAGPDSFYVTNFFSYRWEPLIMLEMVFGAKWVDLVYFDGKSYSSVAGGMNMLNGVAMSNDQKNVYVASSFAQEIRVFKRNKDGSLTLQQVYPAYSLVDNIMVDPTSGDLYVGSHPTPYLLLKHQDDPANRKAPSQVLLMRVKNGNITSTLELFCDDGSLISGSSAATVYNRKLLVGSVLSSLVLCDVDVPL